MAKQRDQFAAFRLPAVSVRGGIPVEYYPLFGQIVSEMRAARHLSKQQLAEMAGTSRKHISRIENGMCLPDVAMHGRIASALGIDLPQFIAMTWDAIIGPRRVRSTADDRFMDELVRCVRNMEKEKMRFVASLLSFAHRSPLGMFRLHKQLRRYSGT